MAIELASGYVSIVPSTRGLGRSISHDLNRPLDAAGRNAGDSASSAFGTRFAAGVGAAAKRAGIALAAGIGIAGGFGIKVAADFEQTTIAFEGILGNADLARKVLGDLRDFATKTPFELTGLADSAKNLLAVGFAADDIIPTMTTLGNVAATLGVGENEIAGVVRALGQMKGKGKASAEELQQISEQIPGFSAITAIAEGMGVTTAEAFEKLAKGAVPADKAIAFILEGMEKFPGAAGAMERQSKTLNGVLSTFKDTLSTTAIDFITPYLPALSAAVQAVGGFVQDTLVPALQSLVDGIGDLVDRYGPAVSEFFSNVLAPAFEAVATAITEHLLPTLGGLIKDGLEALSGWWDRNGDNVKKFFEDVAAIIKDDLAPALGALGDFLWQSVLPALRDFASWIVDNQFAFDTFKALIGGLTVAWLLYAAAAAAASVATILPFLPIRAIIAVGALLAVALDRLIDRFSVGLSEAIQKVIDIGSGIVEFFGDLVGLLKDAIRFAQDFIDLLPDIKLPGASGGGFLPNLPGPADDILRGIFGFDEGGIVPGPRGAPRLVVAHGGETVLPTHRSDFAAGGSTFYLTVNNPSPEPASDSVRALRRVALEVAQ